MKRIPGKDAFFLWSETPTTPMTIAFAGVFDPSTVPGGVSGPGEIYERFRSLITSRIHLVPQFRQRVVEVPLNFGNPYFVDDPHFDIEYHIRRIALPAPGDRHLLEEFIGRIVSRPLDMAKPLWEIYVVEGVEDGKWAYVGKAHHVLVDGVGGNEMLVQLLDLEPTPREVEPPAQTWAPAPLPSELDLVRASLAGAVRKPMQLVGTVRRTADVAFDVVKWGIGRSGDDPGLHVLGPRTFLNGPVGPHRQVALGKFALEDVKVVKKAFGCTVNDVILALTGRALRSWVNAHGEETDKAMVAAVPISIRPKGDTSVENQVSGMTVSVHDDVEDVAEQLRLISKATKPAKEQMGAVAATALQNWSEFAPPAVAAQAFRFYTRMGLARRHPPIANVTLSNVPGPPFALYLAGSRMLSMYPIGPVIINQRVNITVVSYVDTMFVGVAADRDDVPDCRELITHILDALATLVAAASDLAPAEV